MYGPGSLSELSQNLINYAAPKDAGGYIPDSQAVRDIKESYQLGMSLSAFIDKSATDPAFRDANRQKLIDIRAQLDQESKSSPEILGDPSGRLATALADYVKQIDVLLGPTPITATAAVEVTEQKSNVLRSFAQFFFERGIAERASGEPIGEYLKRIEHSLLSIVLETVWEYRGRQVGNPITANADTNPLSGPLLESTLLTKTLVNSTDNWNSVRSFEAFCDNFPASFSNPAEASVARERMNVFRSLVAEIEIWHDRAAIKRQHEDKAGPTRSLEAIKMYKEKKKSSDLSRLFNIEQTSELRKFAEATEFSMSVWAIMALPKWKRDELRPYMNPLAYDIATKYKEAVPDYLASSNLEKTTALKNAIIDGAQAMGLSRKEAELAFHVGQSFRIGSFLEPFLDYGHATDGKAKVGAQEGAIKGMAVGRYVESIMQTEARPDFNESLATTLHNTYLPHAFMMQFEHGMGNISGFGDKRANLIEILAVKGAIFTVDWETTKRSTDVDSAVVDAAVQSVEFFWKLASVKGSADPAIGLFPQPSRFNYKPTQLADDPAEQRQMRKVFTPETITPIGKFTVELGRQIHTLEDCILLALDVDSVAVADQALQDIKERLKQLRDYWLASFKKDLSRFPLDTVRSMQYLFSGDNGYVNPRIGGIIQKFIDQAKANNGNLSKDDVEQMMKQITGYLTYDVFVRAALFLYVPDFRPLKSTLDIDKLTQPELFKLYEHISPHSLETLHVKTRAGGQIVNTSFANALVNQIIEYRDALAGDQAKIVESGYAYSPEAAARGLPIIRADIVKIMEEMHIISGRKVINQNGNFVFARIPREFRPDNITPQDIVDKLAFFEWLFGTGKSH